MNPIFDNGLNSELDGLDGRAKKKAVNYAKRRVRKTLGLKSATRAEAILALNKEKFSANTKSNFASLQTQSAVHYLRSKITGNQNPLLNDATDKIEGITDISKQKLPAGRNFLMTRMEVGFANNGATDIGAKAAAYNPLSFDGGNTTGPAKAAAAIINGELEMIVDSQVLMKIPAKSFNECPKQGGGSANGYNFEVPILIPEEKTIQLVFHSANDVAMPAGYNYLEVVMKGVETKL